MINQRALMVAAIAACLLFSQHVLAKGDPRRGAQLAEQCQNCHGTDGENKIEGFPNLTQQKPKYLVKQLRGMRASAKLRAGFTTFVESDSKTLTRARRSNETMDPFVLNLSDEDINDLAAYYASLPCRAVMSGAPLPPPKFEIRCQICHGKYGIAKNSNIPNIAGQDMLYMEQQLLSFRQAKTEEGDGQEKRRAAIMEGQVRNLSDQDIKDISLYYARLPCR